MNADDATRTEIESLIEKHEVMLFMKGNREMPQCGFSATLIRILDALAPDYGTADVLQDPALREGIKAFSSWPTVPQLYLRGEFVGGCDIVQELFASGELHEKFGVDLAADVSPTITVTDAAADGLRAAVANVPPDGRSLHLQIDARYQGQLAMAPREEGEIDVSSNGVALVLDRLSAQRADGVTIDAVDTPQGTGFRIDNPNAPAGPA